MSLIPESRRSTVESRLKALLPCATWQGIMKEWEFYWYANGSIRARNTLRVGKERADFTVIFTSLQPLTVFKVMFNGKESQEVARKFKLRDDIDDLLWNMLPNDTSAYQLAINQ